MELSMGENDFLSSFEHIQSKDISNKNKLDVFILNSNANDFDYKLLERNLLDPIITYSLSRKVKEKYGNRAGILVSKAK